MAQAKTNAMRLLETQKIAYRIHTYSADGDIDGVSVAQKTGQPPERVFKTLVAHTANGGLAVFCIPVAAHLNLKAAARAAGVKSIEMAAVKELFPLTGYVRGGCTPLGMKKTYPAYLDQSALLHPSILISGGRIGTQIELSPADLLRAANANPAALTYSSTE